MSEIVSVRVSPPTTATNAGGDIVVSGGRAISGWEDVSITCRCDGFPNQFNVSASSLDPVTRASTPGNPGDLCTVRIGDDIVITGYLDQVVNAYTPTSHSLSFTGRGKTQDLVDCSAEIPNGQMLYVDAVSVSETIASAYNLEVALGNGATAGPQMPQWALDYGETGAAIIQRLAQNAGLLAYEDADGRVLLANVGTEIAATGIAYGPGGNIEAFSATYSMDERYSNVVCALFSNASYNDIPGSDFFHEEKDPNVLRHRQLDVLLEGIAGDPYEFAIRKAKWEIARRAGRSTVIQATVDSWRDGAGKLWMPNTTVPVSVPNQRFAGPLVLASVTYRRDAKTGTHADLTLMPKEAFTIEPISLLAVNAAAVKPMLPAP